MNYVPDTDNDVIKNERFTISEKKCFIIKGWFP